MITGNGRFKMLRWFAVALMVAGLILLGYPLYLKYRADREQEEIRRDFYDQVSLIDENREIKEAPPPEEPRWEEWPHTKMLIPEISLEVFIDTVEDAQDLGRSGQSPGHFPDTALPGEDGNVVVGGHRTGPADYFLDLDHLSEGDEIILETPRISYHYRVEWMKYVDSRDWSVVDPTDYAALTIITCPREGSQVRPERFVVRSRLEEVSFPQNQPEE